MSANYTTEKKFDKTDFTVTPFVKGEYENCAFVNCNLSETDLSACIFIECEFSGCNLSLAKLGKTALRDVKFKECKMLGLRFDQCNDFGLLVSFENCSLNHSSFYKMKLKKIIFRNSQLQEVDFTESDLTGALLDGCDLLRATFENTMLEKADLRTAYNYSIDPEINRIKRARFSLGGVAGLLDKYDIEIE